MDTQNKRKQISGSELTKRILLFFVLYFGWPLIKHFYKPIIFAVYGTEKDQRAYWPSWVHKRLRGAFPIGLLRFNNQWGFVAASSINAEQFDKNPALATTYVQELLREFPKARVIALAGGIPGWVRRVHGEIPEPCVDGSLGTRFAMVAATLDAARILNTDSKSMVIALIGGAGYTGSKVVIDVAEYFHSVIALDTKNQGNVHFDKNHRILHTDSGITLRNVRISLVLTRRGDDIENLIPFLAPSSIVIDDTHPCMSPRIRKQLFAKGVDVWKAVMADGRLQMYPRMPNFRSDNIPGCLLEALVVLQRGRAALSSFDIFSSVAKDLGFKAELMRHPDD